VSDNGAGIDAATQTRIFEPFFTTKPAGKGVGLGLSVVHAIVQDHGASLELQSAPGAGATFRIYFPAVDVTNASSVARREAAQSKTRASGGDERRTPSPEGAGKHILYIDDDEAMVFLLTRLLERHGYRVSGYTDAREALAAVRAKPGEFDLAVSDFNMPRMSGLDVARELREIRPDLPVVVISGYLTEELRSEAPAAGVRQLIYKPNSVEELSDAIARLLTTNTAHI
jgi:CheY-like chemotaxis protein